LMSGLGVPGPTGTVLPSQQPGATGSAAWSPNRRVLPEAPLDSAYALPAPGEGVVSPTGTGGADAASKADLDARARASARVDEDLGLPLGSKVDDAGLLPRLREDGLPPGSGVDGAGLQPRLRSDDADLPPGLRVDAARASARLDEDLGLPPTFGERTPKLTEKQIKALRKEALASDPRLKEALDDKEGDEDQDKQNYWDRAARPPIWAPHVTLAARPPAPADAGSSIQWDYLRDTLRKGVTKVLTWAGDY
jgi:hypothetical protein